MRWLAVLAVSIGLTGFAPPSRADDAAMTHAVTQESETAHYRLLLRIGPSEVIYTVAEARARHPTAGEIMVRGRLVRSLTGATHDLAGDAVDADGPMELVERSGADTRCIELHVYSRLTGRTVAEAHVAITITGADKKSRSLPIAQLYGIGAGPDDLHYGNNLRLQAGAYMIVAAVNGERHRFRVIVPEGV